MKHLANCSWVAFAAVFGFAVAATQGTVFHWATPSTGGFTSASNWTPGGGPPNDGNDTAVFDVLGGYTTRIHSNVTNNNFEVRAGSVTFDLYEEEAGQFGNLEFGYVYTLDTTTGIAANISSSAGASLAAKLTVQGDTESFPAAGEDAQVSTSAAVHIGSAAGTKGILEITNHAEWINSQFTIVGSSGQGTMILSDGGEMSNSLGLVGFLPGSSGTVTVSDGSSRWDNSGTLTVGAHGTANMTIADSGIVSNQGDAFIATIPGHSSTVTLNDGRWINNAALYVGGTAIATGGSARLTLEDLLPNGLNTSVEVDDNMVIRSTGTVDVINQATLDVGGQLTIDAGGKLNIDGEFAVVNASSLAGGAGTLNWTAGTVNITNGDFTADANSPTGFVFVVGEDMTLNVSDTLRVGPTGNGLLFIVRDGDVNSDSVEIGGTGTIPLAVEGLGSTLTVTGDINMGSVGGAGAQLVVSEQGVASNDNAFVSAAAGQHSELLMQSLAGGTAQWNNAGSVYLGGNETTAGGTAELTINTGGAVTIGGQLRVWDNATVEVDTGTITTPLMHVSGSVDYTGTLDLTGAGPVTALDLDGGTVSADKIDLGVTDFSGHGTLAGDVVAHGTVTAEGSLTLGDPTSFTGLTLTGPLNVGAHTVTLLKAGFFNIGQFTTIAGGTLSVPNGAAVPVGNSILAHGAITGRIAAQSGTTVMATGDLALGDAASVAGFFSDGELVVGDHLVEILDANAAVLGSLTTIGDQSTLASPGTLTAVNGSLLEQGKNVAGYGVINGDFINQGYVEGVGPDAGDAIEFTGDVSGIGSFDGNIIFSGGFSPGNSPAAINIGGNAIFPQTNTVEIELGGTTPGDQYDQINITQNVSLGGGDLDVFLINGFMPSYLDEFVVITAGSRSGEFGQMNGLLINPDMTLAPVYDYEGNIGLTLVAAIPGDANLDGIVNGLDLLRWQSNLFSGDQWVQGDFNLDGLVNGLDLLTWQSHLFDSVQSLGGGAVAAAQSVPEPGAVWLLAVGGAALLLRRRGFSFGPVAR